MALFIEIKAADGLVSRTRLDPGTNRFTVRLGDSYRIFDDQTGVTPEGVAVKRVDNNLVVDGLGPAAPDKADGFHGDAHSQRARPGRPCGQGFGPARSTDRCSGRMR